jgi:peroxiredoxin
MKVYYIRLIFIITLVTVIFVIIFFFFKKEQTKKQFSSLPDFSFTEIDGYVNSTKILPSYDGYMIIMFINDCEACNAHAKLFAENLKSLENFYLLFLSPDSLETIKSFIIKNQLYDKENVNYGHIDSKIVYLKFGKSTIPRVFIYNENRKLIKSGVYINKAELRKYFTK